MNRDKDRENLRKRNEQDDSLMPENQNPNTDDNQIEMQGGNNIFLKRTLIVVAMLIILFGMIYACIHTYLSGFKFISTNAERTEEEINQFESDQKDLDASLISGLEEIVIETPTVPASTPTATPVPKKELRYILLIGLDTRSTTNYEKASSDVMKLLIIDEDNNELKLVSFMRDILIEVEGQYEVDGNQMMNKLNSIYFFNGPEGLCRTISDKFQVPVDEYVIINWYGVVDLVNAMGGVEVDVKSSELRGVNEAIEVQRRLKYIEYTSTLYKNGPQILNGNQALAYCRVRSCGNGDYDRVNRQVTVLKALFDGLGDASFEEILTLLDVLQDVVKTNIPPAELLKYAEIGYGMLDADITSLSIPVGADGETHTAGKYNGRYVLKLDYPANVAALHEFIGDDE